MKSPFAMKTSTILALSIAIGLAGCTAQRVYIRTYDGPPLRQEQEALLKPYLGTIIKSINGDPKYAMKPMRIGQPNIDADISLRPGKTTIVLGYELHGPNTAYLWATGDMTIEFDALPGKKYRLNVQLDGSTKSMRPIVEDVTDFPEKWCWYDRECAKHGPSRPITDDMRK